jgi:hypothetical protein
VGAVWFLGDVNNGEFFVWIGDATFVLVKTLLVGWFVF